MLSKAKPGLPGIINADSGIETAIKQQLDRQRKLLYYPLSVARFYRTQGYKLAWVAPDTVKTHAGDAMILLDCVNQYGLNYANYHPGELTYTRLDLLTKHNQQTGNLQKAQFDIWLTDAVITFINNLHYGRYNPDHPAGKIDVDINGFNAASVLKIALLGPDFAKAITDVQPKSIAYTRLHRQLYLKTGLYAGDCYEFPEADIKLMAVNMERLRWYNAWLKNRFELNIPSSTLIIHEPDSNYYLKVNADALITFVKAYPDLRVARIDVKGDKINLLVSSTLDKNTKDLPVKSSDIDNNKISGQRSVVISGRDKAIANLLKGQSKKDTQGLNITYITCTIENGELIKYQDPLKADRALQNKLYGEKRIKSNPAR